MSILERCTSACWAGWRLWPVAAIIVWVFLGSCHVGEAAPANGPRLEVVGAVQDVTGRGIAGVRVRLELSGQPLTTEIGEPLVTDKQGRFQGTFILPAGVVPPGQVIIQASKPSWQPQTARLTLQPAPQPGPAGQVHQAMGVITLSRQITPAFWLAAGILLAVYLSIALGWRHRALAALLGAAGMLFLSYTLGQYSSDFFIISFDEAIAAIDMNVILLLLGMMLLVGVTKKTGLFQWLAYKAFTWARGRVVILVLILMWLTAVVSAFLDNVTTMLVLIPVAVELAQTLKLNPVSLLIPQVFAANVGGTATLIGDPPNMIIGSSANLTFGDFVVHLTPVIILCMAAACGFFLWYYRREYARTVVLEEAGGLAPLRQRYRLADRRQVWLCLIMLALLILGLSLQGLLGMKPAVAALLAAVLLVAVSRVDIAELLVVEIQWASLLFILALYIVVAGAAETGLPDLFVQELRQLVQGNLTLTLLLVLWGSALLSAIIDTIPLTITLLPIVSGLTATLPGAENGVLWWALALGAGLGGNGTMTGASATGVTVGLAERAGYPLAFFDYLQACFLPMLLTGGLCSVYLFFFH